MLGMKMITFKLTLHALLELLLKDLSGILLNISGFSHL